MREGRVDTPNRFAKDALAQRRTAAAGIVGDDDRESLVQRAGPQGSLAQARVAHDGNPARVDRGVGFEVIHRAAQTPGPSSDRAPLVRRRLGLSLLVEEWMHAVLEAIMKIRVNVAAVNRGQA